jgi:hypothetical protein
MNFVTQRLREPSSWAGIGAIISMGAHAVATKDPQAIAGTLAGVLALLMPEAKK